MTEAVVRGQSLVLRFGTTAALVDASIEVRAGEAIAVIGPSGSGKSSLLHCLSGLVRPSEGQAWFRDLRLDIAPDAQLSELRRSSFGFVFQFGELIAELTLEENISLPLRFSGRRRTEAEAKAANLLDEVGIGDLARRRPSQVSGGQMQRAVVARALINDPVAIFADEPTGALDSETGQQVLSLLLERARARGAALILVTHDDRVAQAADRIVLVRDGKTYSSISAEL